MTYATDAKFVIGKLYEFTGVTGDWTSNAQNGSIWRFTYDDGTYAPKFEYVSGQQSAYYKVGDTTFLHVSQFKAYEEKRVVANYTIRVDEGGTNIFIQNRLTVDQLHKVIAIIVGAD